MESVGHLFAIFAWIALGLVALLIAGGVFFMRWKAAGQERGI